MDKVRKRSEIPEEYKWDLSVLIKDEREFLNILKEIERELENLKKYQGHLFDSAQKLLEYCQKSTVLEKKLVDAYVWANLNKYEDLSSSKATDYVLQVTNLNNKIAENTSWVDTEIIAHEEKEFDDFLKLEPKLQDFAFQFRNLFRSKEHILSENEEKLISKLTKTYGKVEDTYDILNDSENNLGTVEIDGENIQLTQSNYVELMRNSNQSTRQNIFKTYYQYYQEHRNTYASLYATNVMEDNTIAGIRKYPNCLAMALSSENIDEKVYKNLLDAVEKYMDLAYEYQEIRAKLLKIKEYHIYDNYVEFACDNRNQYTVSKCQEILFEALKPLGQNYLDKLKFMFDSKYIDYYPSENKRSGAYQWHRYVSLNHLNTSDSLTTMAHELGHAMNTLYTEENQPNQYQDNPIFLAEIASTLNEVLLNEYLYQKTTNKEDKITQILDFLSRVHSTIYRQTMFAEFEYLMHQKEQNGVSLTEEFMSQEYYKLVQKYFTKNMIIDEEIKYEWMRIPHFYTSFYVYKYAIGLICALIFAKRILNQEENAVADYIKFLASGASDYPLNILKKANIDLTDPKVFDEAFALIKEKINELKEVMQDE